MKKFENYLLHVTRTQKWMIYASVLLVVVFFINTFTTPMVEELEAQQSQIENLQNSIASNSANRLKKEIAQKGKVLLEINEAIEQDKERVTFFMSSLYKLKYAFFDEREFANSLDTMLKKSLSSQLSIEHIKTIALPKETHERLLKHKKRLEITGFGEYKAIVAFIAHIEQQEMLLNFDSIKIEANEKNVTFKLLLDIYGIGL